MLKAATPFNTDNRSIIDTVETTASLGIGLFVMR
jgi:hypothetical protein